MKLNKKNWLVNPILLPLIVAPVAIISSCATNTYVLAQVLIQQDAISFIQGKGHYSQKQLASFKDQPETLLKDLNINNISGFNLNDYEFTTVNVDYKLRQSIIWFQIQISNKKDQSDVATTKIITLHFTNA